MSAISFKHASRLGSSASLNLKKKKKTKRRKKHTFDSFQLSPNPPITDQYIMLIINRIVCENCENCWFFFPCKQGSYPKFTFTSKFIILQFEPFSTITVIAAFTVGTNVFTARVVQLTFIEI